MLEQLEDIEAQLSDLLEDAAAWKTLDVDYEPPRVERVWRQVGDLRVCLHRIHPCEKALMHPHPWPSAMRVVKGSYKMGLSLGVATVPSSLVLTAGSAYEMVDIHAWHYVRPLNDVAYSLMIMGPKYEEQVHDHSKFGAGRDLKPLSNKARADIMQFFATWAVRNSVVKALAAVDEHYAGLQHEQCHWDIPGACDGICDCWVEEAQQQWATVRAAFVEPEVF